jgi:hypothetical protein
LLERAVKFNEQQAKLKRMADDSWQKVREIFDLALCLKPEERQKFVHKKCGDDKTLVSEVESLLASLDSADSFWKRPPLPMSPT